MVVYNDPLLSLAARVGAGDVTAVAHLRAELEPRLGPEVQRVLHIGPNCSPLDRQIERELAFSGRSHPGGRQALVAQVARRVCTAIITELRSQPRTPEALKDTVRNLERSAI